MGGHNLPYSASYQQLSGCASASPEKEESTNYTNSPVAIWTRECFSGSGGISILSTSNMTVSSSESLTSSPASRLLFICLSFLVLRPSRISGVFLALSLASARHNSIWKSRNQLMMFYLGYLCAHCLAYICSGPSKSRGQAGEISDEKFPRVDSNHQPSDQKCSTLLCPPWQKVEWNH